MAGLPPLQRTLDAGEYLFRRGDKATGVFFLAAGRLRMQRATPDGGAVSVHAARPGELFAEASLFADRYHCDAVAETACEVWHYPKGALTTHLQGDPAALWQFAAELARSLHRLRQRYELKQTRAAPERVLQYLRLACDADCVFRPKGAWKEVAAELGLTHEAFYRALATLEKQGRIVRGEGELQLVARRN
jgi:CRP-like cAMP-binding protein